MAAWQPQTLSAGLTDSSTAQDVLTPCCKATLGYIKQQTSHFLHGWVLCLTQVPRSDLELLKHLRQSQHDKRVGEFDMNKG